MSITKLKKLFLIILFIITGICLLIAAPLLYKVNNQYEKTKLFTEGRITSITKSICTTPGKLSKVTYSGDCWIINVEYSPNNSQEKFTFTHNHTHLFNPYKVNEMVLVKYDPTNPQFAEMNPGEDTTTKFFIAILAMSGIMTIGIGIYLLLQKIKEAKLLEKSV